MEGDNVSSPSRLIYCLLEIQRMFKRTPKSITKMPMESPVLYSPNPSTINMLLGFEAIIFVIFISIFSLIYFSSVDANLSETYRKLYILLLTKYMCQYTFTSHLALLIFSIIYIHLYLQRYIFQDIYFFDSILFFPPPPTKHLNSSCSFIIR